MRDPVNDNDNESLGEIQEEADYICDSCGEQIVIPIDFTAGAKQNYVEDCPVCCNPNVISVEVDEDGRAYVESRGE